MKKILILCRRDERTDYDTAASMTTGLQAVAANDIRYVASVYEELVCMYDGSELRIQDGNGDDLRTYSAIFQLGWFKTKILEDMALSVALYAEHHNIPHRNTEALYNRSTRKISQYTASALNGLQTIPFVFSCDVPKMMAWARQQELPLIVKDASGSRGSNNHLVHSYEEIEAILQDTDVPYLIQAFIDNDGDYRLLVAGGSVVLAILRKGSGESHLNNTSKGGSGSLVAVGSLDQSMKHDAVTIASLLRREFSGIDMVVDKKSGKHYFLEANNMPQISTGSNVAAKLAVLNAYLAKLSDNVTK